MHCRLLPESELGFAPSYWLSPKVFETTAVRALRAFLRMDEAKWH
jgi:hypothetical protein